MTLKLLLPLLFINLYAKNITLNLKCIDIPSNNIQLCTLETPSSYGIYNDIVFYSKDIESNLYLIDSYQSDISNFGGFGFSDTGKYMYVSWAEEGHEYFIFYKTKEFLQKAQKANVVNVLYEYDFKEFLSFKDSGIITYSLYSKKIKSLDLTK